MTSRRPDRDADSNLHPATEFVLLFCALVLIYGISSPVVPLIVLLASAVGAVRSPTGFRRWAATWAVLSVPMLVMVGIVQGLFYPDASATVLHRWGPAAVTVEGLAIAVQLWLRVAAMIAACALFALGTDSARAFDGMRRLRVPLGIAYVCATAMSLAPLVRDRTRHALEARAARGWETNRLRIRVALMPGIIGGLLTTALVQLDQRHDTLTQRGFGATARPAPLQDRADPMGQRALRWAAPVCTVALVAASLSGVLTLPSASEVIAMWGGPGG